MWDHYWLPCIIGIAGLNGAALAYLGRDPNKWLFRIAFVSVILWMGNGIRVNFQAVENFANRTHAHQEALKYVVERTPSSGKILIFEEGAIATAEYAFSWVFFLAHEGRPNTKVFLYDSKNEDRGRFAKSLFFPYGDALVSIPACEFDSIIFLTQPKESDIDWKRWYAEGCHEIHTVIGRQRYLSLKQRRWTTEEFKVIVATKKQLNQ